MQLNCIIVDDEPLAAELLASYAGKTPCLEMLGTFSSAIEANKIIREKKVDLIFLDIQMPELSGIEFAKIISPDTKIIFTTAFSQYAVEGYKVDAADYLLKPVSYNDFLRATNKVLGWFVEKERNRRALVERFIFVKSEYKLVNIKLDDILFIEGVKDYVKFYLVNNRKPVMSLMNMKKIEEFLPKPEFMRTHRSYIVHMSKVEMVDRFRFVFGDYFIPISDSHKDSVQAFIDDHTLT